MENPKTDIVNSCHMQRKNSVSRKKNKSKKQNIMINQEKGKINKHTKLHNQ